MNEERTQRPRRGPQPERLKIDGPWEAAAARLVKAGPYPGAKKKRAKRRKG